jgi:hypothetical protein
VRRLDDSDIYRPADESGWARDSDAGVLVDVLRSTLHESHADASDEEVADALADVFDSMSPAEAFNFASALHRIGRSAGQLISDPAFAAVAQTALPVLGGAAGTLIGGPVGTALGSKLGSLAAGALPARPGPAQAAAPPTAVTAASPPGSVRRVPLPRWRAGRPRRRRAWC